MSLVANLIAVIGRIADEDNAIRVLINGDVADLSALLTTDKSSLLAALNEVFTIASNAGGGGAAISDGVTATDSTWSSSKIATSITAAINALEDAAPEALNTLKELSTALNDDPTFAATITTALGNRLQFDVAQTLTAGQKTQGLTNLGAASSSALATTNANLTTLSDAIGDTETDFVAAYEATLNG